MLELEFNTLGLVSIKISNARSVPQRSDTTFYGEVTTAIDAFFALEPFKMPKLDWTQCSEFQTKVLLALSAIPKGTTVSYSQVAHRIGASKAARAVGTSLRLNPWPLLIPCHRVIRANSDLGNYSLGGKSVKEKLLSMESSQNYNWT